MKNISKVKTTCGDTIWNSLNWVVISSEKELEVTALVFSELIATQLREFHMMSPQVVVTLLIFLTMQSYKFYLWRI